MRYVLLSILLMIGILAYPPSRAAPAASGRPRRVNAPFFSSDVAWEQSAVFWFGKNEQGIPSRNYVDVRVAYTPQSLQLQFTVVDYYLWYEESPTAASDLAQYDAVAVYLDIEHDRSAFPNSGDYFLLSGARPSPNGNAPEYHRQGRGSGSGWNTAWSGQWTDYSAMQWLEGGPNDNSGTIDFGWVAILDVPFSTLGLTGPPPAGRVFGLGVALFDRDAQPPAGAVAPEHWPETFDASTPSTWGELHFGYASYQPPALARTGGALIRSATVDDSTALDVWMGGGGSCSGGHEGGSEVNHFHELDNNLGRALFVGTETQPTHFPCFNKSFLRFSLAAIPPGKAILSASLTLHLWGGADPSQAQPSWVHLLTISDAWDPWTIHWNNAPLAQENVSAAWLYPYTKPLVWPGDPYTWDATQAVAEAYAQGQPLNVALYGSDTDQHSSKYLTGSWVEDWDLAGRPALAVAWGDAVSIRTYLPAVRR